VILARADRVVAISRHVAVNFAGAGWASRGVRVVDNAVDLERFDPARVDRAAARAAVGIHTGEEPVIGVIAQLTPWKGQDLAIRVLAALRARTPSAVLLLTGQAKFVTAATRFDNRAFERLLHELTRDLGVVSQVRFLGERDDPEQVLRATDVLLVPSIEEPFGRTIIEAMAMEVPVVATRAGGAPEILRAGIDGLLVDSREPEEWARAVQEAAEWSPDRRAGARAAAAARFSRSRHVQQMRGVYEEALAHDGSGRPVKAV
jgi:D-inositol-3-phosphate glycosyltransferase